MNQMFFIYGAELLIQLKTLNLQLLLQVLLNQDLIFNGIAVSSGAITVQLSATPGLEFSANLLQVQSDSTGGANLATVIDRNSNGLAVRVDDSTIEDDGNGATGQLRLKDGGITNAKINAAAAIDTSKLADATELSEAVTFFANTDITGAQAETLTDGSNADALHSHSDLFLTLTNNTGAQINAGSVVALSKSTAGEIILADASAIATCEAIPGVVVSNIADAASGLVQIKGTIAPTQDAAFSLGARVYVSETAGSSTSTAPSTAGTVVHVLGTATSTTEVNLNPHLVGIN